MGWGSGPTLVPGAQSGAQSALDQGLSGLPWGWLCRPWDPGDPSAAARLRDWDLPGLQCEARAHPASQRPTFSGDGGVSTGQDGAVRYPGTLEPSANRGPRRRRRPPAGDVH